MDETATTATTPTHDLTGAEALVRTLADCGVEVCFANPGTSEMQFVDALGRTGLLRCVLGLFEGVATGAADGYARMAGKPAATLLHLGPGLANAGANIHNARKARTPMVNLVGDHASRHLAYDAPLTSDIAALAKPLSDWVRTAGSAATIASDGAAAVAEAMAWPGRIATLIAPGEAGWDQGATLADPLASRGPRALGEADLQAAVTALQAPGQTVLFVGGPALASADTLALLAGLAAKTGAEVLAPTSNPRIERGRGRAAIERLPYAIDLALERLSHIERAILIGVDQPVGFFAYPGKPSLMLPEGAEVLTLAAPDQDGREAVTVLAERLGVTPLIPADAPEPEAPAPGELTPETLATAVAAALPEHAIVIDEGITAGRAVWPATAGCPPHTWLALTGGAIGIGPPLALGAAVACPERPVVAIQADGSAMYTIQALWSQAREGANVTTVVLANRRYDILRHELFKVGANPGPQALSLLDIGNPALDFVALARAQGVEASRVTCPAALAHAIAASVRKPGPQLIEAVLP
ncbi:MAG: acetolactate synthase large subunit [Pseudomonadota bacterium]